MPPDNIHKEIVMLTELRERYRSNVHFYELQASGYSTLNVPRHIATSLEFERSQLASVETQLADLQAQLSGNAVHALEAIRSRYLQHLIATHRVLTFQGILQTAKPIALPLTEVYVALRATQGAGEGDAMGDDERRILGQLHDACPPEQRERLEQELERLGRERWSRTAQPINIATALKDHQVMVVLGDPGAGKSTLLRYLALVFAQHVAQERLALDEQRMPILVPLAAYDAALRNDDTLPLSAFLSRWYAERHELPNLGPLFEQALESGTVLVLLDGLDEVLDSDSRRAIAQRVQSFITRYTPLGNRIMVTSRIAGYRGAPLPGDVPHYTVLDFGPQEIDHFTQQWCRAYERHLVGDTPEADRAAAEEQQRLVAAIQGNVGIQRLASNPLLLTILALIHRQGKSLPRRRIELYDLYVRTLLESWNRARTQGLAVGKSLDVLDTVKVLAPLALCLQRHKPAGTLTTAELTRELCCILREQGNHAPEREAQSWLRDIREWSGLLVERGTDAWGFLHLTFQEYFAARALAMVSHDKRWAVLKPHLHDSRWREVILLTAGQLGVMHADEKAVTRFVQAIQDAGSLLEDVLWRDFLLTAAVLGEDVGVASAVAQPLAMQVGERWLRATADEREWLHSALHGLGGTLSHIMPSTYLQ